MAALHHTAQDWRRGPTGGRWPAIAAIAAAHGLALYAALHSSAVRQHLTEARPLFVSFIAAPPAPPLQAPPPKPAQLQPRPEPRLIAAPQPTAAAMQASQPPVPLEPLPDTAPPAPPAPPVPAEAALTPPSFVAAYLDNPPPQYPRLSRQLKESGRVLLRVRVDAAGRSEQLELRRSSGFDRLDQAALEAVRQWRFVPARQGGQAVAAWVIVPINFQLDQ